MARGLWDSKGRLKWLNIGVKFYNAVAGKNLEIWRKKQCIDTISQHFVNLKKKRKSQKIAFDLCLIVVLLLLCRKGVAMYYMFSEDKELKIEIDDGENLQELKKRVREYYKGKAIDNDDPYWEVDGYITTLDRHGNPISQANYYATGSMARPEKVHDMFFKGGFI